MSLVFNDTATYKGIVQLYERELGFQRGDISNDTNRLKELAADANLAFDDFLNLAFNSDGRWSYDDSNFSDYPIITTNVVSGQRDYQLTTDGGGNLILEVKRVVMASSTGIFYDLTPVDVESDLGTTSFYDGQNASGPPTRYDKLANGIFLDPVPNYSYTNGLKLYVNREPSYFVYTDTTKKPGVPGLFHKWFVLRPAEDYARRNSLPQLPNIESQRVTMQTDIQEYFATRNKDERQGMTPGYQNNH